MANVRKEQTVEELRAAVDGSNGAILTDYRGLTVAEVTSLRRKLIPLSAEYRVVKNTLFSRAISDTLTPDLQALLEGPTAIAFTRGDTTAAAKAIVDFLRDLKKPEIKIKGGWFEGTVYTSEQIAALAKLPPRDQILAQLIGALNGPAANLVGVLDSIASQFVWTVQAIVESRRQAAGQASHAAVSASTSDADATAGATSDAAEQSADAAEAPTAEAEQVAEAVEQPVEEAASATTQITAAEEPDPDAAVAGEESLETTEEANHGENTDE